MPDDPDLLARLENVEKAVEALQAVLDLLGRTVMQTAPGAIDRGTIEAALGSLERIVDRIHPVDLDDLLDVPLPHAPPEGA